MTTLARNHRWRDLFTADRAIASLNIMNQMKPTRSTQARKESANESLPSTKNSKSRKDHFAPPVVLSKYRHFKLSSDSIRSRTLKLINRERDEEVKGWEVLNTERGEKLKQLREKLSQYTGRIKNRNGSKDNPQSTRRLVSNRFIIRTRSNILTKFEQSSEHRFLTSLNESRIESKPQEESRQQMQATRKGWAKIIKCLQL